VLSQFQSQLQQRPNPEQQQETQEDIDERNNALIDELMSNPLAVIQRIQEDAAKAAREQISPILAEREQQRQEKVWVEAASNFASQVDANGQLLRPDFGDLADDIARAYQVIPGLQNNPNSLEIAYNYAKGTRQSTQPTAAQLDPSVLAKDQNFLNNYILNNPEIKNKLLTQHVNDLRSSSPPTLMGSGGAPAIVPPTTRPQNSKEAKNMFMAMLDKFTG
jgi:hypothetical protein